MAGFGWLSVAAIAAVLGVAASAAAAPAPPAGPSFDCVHAQGIEQVTICANPELALQDKEAAELLALLQTDALGAGPSTEADEQSKMLAERDANCPQKAPTEIVACIRQSYDSRLILLAGEAVIRAPDLALTTMRQEMPDQAPIYEAIWRMTTMPAGAARTNAVAKLIGPEFTKERATQADMLPKGVTSARAAAASLKNFDAFLDLTGAVDVATPITLPCEAIVRQPALIHALDSMFGSSMDNQLPGSDCDTMLPAPPRFGAMAADVINLAMSDPDCTGTLRYAGLRYYNEFLIAAQLARQGTPARPDAAVARQSAAFQHAHAAEVADAATDLAAYYTRELHTPNAPAAAQRAVGEVVDAAYDVCDQ